MVGKKILLRPEYAGLRLQPKVPLIGLVLRVFERPFPPAWNQLLLPAYWTGSAKAVRGTPRPGTPHSDVVQAGAMRSGLIEAGTLLITQRARPWTDQLSDDHSRSQATSSRRGALPSKNHRSTANASSLFLLGSGIIQRVLDRISLAGACAPGGWSSSMPKACPEFLAAG